VERGDELPYVPEHLLAFDVGGGGRIWGIHTSGSYVGDMRDVAGRGDIIEAERVPRHFVMDLLGEIRPTAHTNVYLSIQNLLNTPYMVSRRPYGARPGVPFQFMVGFKYLFF
jgi:Fe(3+) dicitrate transport protein